MLIMRCPFHLLTIKSGATRTILALGWWNTIGRSLCAAALTVALLRLGKREFFEPNRAGD